MMNKALGIGLAVALLSAGVAVWLYGNARENVGENKTVVSQIVAVEEIREKHEKKKQEIHSIDDVERIKRYCKWVRDSSYSECVRTYSPVD